MIGEQAENRVVLRLTGSEREHFLHGLVTRDVGKPGDGLTYAALLTPQGKYLADFFLLNRGDDLLLDVDAGIAQALTQRLMMYKLRADVEIEESGLPVARGLGEPPEGAWRDPRHPSLGWRAYGVEAAAPSIDWDAIRVAACIPATGIELVPDDSYILEAGFDRLSGVDHRKGCYVGQEVTARMKHKTELRKGLVTVSVDGSAPVGTPITDADGRAVGTLYTQAKGQGIAYLRYDRAGGEMWAGTAKLTWNGEKPV
ncbi:folate-binding protein [Roseibacterium beibuensis]|uniref:Folate-binding protein YgfZ n=1 Tax=[Roseibacterium] beibuensis TaxID=1193142 RepID=A0ABP9L7Q5_9RHOB|nr:folate-binding protein [Roseibacterium beibuensis]MCS6624204.1 folate-binding protein [Roseibacterium beibuensis]